MAMATTILRTMLLKSFGALLFIGARMIATRSVSLVLRSQNRGVSPRARYCWRIHSMPLCAASSSQRPM